MSFIISRSPTHTSTCLSPMGPWSSGGCRSSLALCLILFAGVGPGVTPPKIRWLPREPQQCSVPGLAFLAASCYDRPMRSYVGCIDLYGLRRFLLEDAVPKDLLRQLVQEWSSRTTVVWAVVAEDNPEAIRRELMADCHWTACNLLLNRAAELLPLVSVVPDLAEPLP